MSDDFDLMPCGGKASEEELDGQTARIIARHPCIIGYPDVAIPEKKRVTITEDCTECNFCLDRFECPALYLDQEVGRTSINREICTDCGVCIHVCPKGAIVEVVERT